MYPNGQYIAFHKDDEKFAVVAYEVFDRPDFEQQVYDYVNHNLDEEDLFRTHN